MYKKTALASKQHGSNNTPFTFSSQPCHKISAAELYKLIITVETPPDESIEAFRNLEEGNMPSISAFLSAPSSSPIKMITHSNSQTVGGLQERNTANNNNINFCIIDVREPALYDRYALISSINFPKNDYMIKDRILSDLYIARNQKKQIIIVDQGTPSGIQNTCTDAEEVGNKLVLTGFFQDVYVLNGGLSRMAEEYPLAFEGIDVPILIEQAQKISKSKELKRVPLSAPRGSKIIQGKVILPSATNTNNTTDNNNRNTLGSRNSTNKMKQLASPSSVVAVSTGGRQNNYYDHEDNHQQPELISKLMNNNNRSNSIVSNTTKMTNTNTSPVKGAVCVSILGKTHSTFGTSNRFGGSSNVRNL